MRMHCNRRLQRAQRGITRWVREAEPNHFFNLLTGPKLLTMVEQLLPSHRERRYPPTQTLAMFLAQVTRAKGACQQAVDEEVLGRLRWGLTALSANTAGYCQARLRLPLEMVQTLGRYTGELLAERTPVAWLWRGRPVKLVDGTTVSMPDTAANQACFPQHGKQQPGAGFPLARLVAVVSLATGAVLDAAIGPFKGKGSGEHSLFRRLLEGFVRHDVMVADGYFPSFFLVAELRRREVDGVFAQGRRRPNFRRGERLGHRDHRVRWRKPANRPDWMSREEYLAYPDEITVREVQVGGKVLVTTFLEACDTPKGALGELYRSRWNVELDIRNIKATLGMDILSCKTPEMCVKEIWVYLLAYNLIRLLMAEAALRSSVLPRELSFKRTVQIWIVWSERQFLSPAGEDVDALFALIAHVKVGNRRGRCEPRAVKRRPKTYQRLDKPRGQARRELEQARQRAAA